MCLNVFAPEKSNSRMVRMPLIVSGALLAHVKTRQTVELLQVTCCPHKILEPIQVLIAKWALASFVARDAGFDLHIRNSLRAGELLSLVGERFRL